MNAGGWWSCGGWLRISRSEVCDLWIVVCGEHSDDANVNCGGAGHATGCAHDPASGGWGGQSVGGGAMFVRQPSTDARNLLRGGVVGALVDSSG